MVPQWPPMLPDSPTFFGFCDHKPGEFYVATLFHPPAPVPLIPVSSWVISEAYVQVTHGKRRWYAPTLDSVRIPLSLKSVSLAYFRVLMVLLGIMSALAIAWKLALLIVMRRFEPTPLIVLPLLALVAFAAYRLSISLSGPGPKKVRFLRATIQQSRDDDDLVSLADDDDDEPDESPRHRHPATKK
jgi:hypothetical protein